MRRVAPAMSEAISHSSRWSRTFSMAPPRGRTARGTRPGPALGLQLVRVEARRLVDGLDQVLADARLVLLVHLDERLLPLALLLRRERDDLGLAALLHGL